MQNPSQGRIRLESGWHWDLPPLTVGLGKVCHRAARPLRPYPCRSGLRQQRESPARREEGLGLIAATSEDRAEIIGFGGMDLKDHLPSSNPCRGWATNHYMQPLSCTGPCCSHPPLCRDDAAKGTEPCCGYPHGDRPWVSAPTPLRSLIRDEAALLPCPFPILALGWRRASCLELHSARLVPALFLPLAPS